MSEVAVRRAIAADARAVAEFAIALFRQHRGYDPVRFADIANVDGAEWFYSGRAEAEDAAVLVAELDGRLVGFAYIEYEEVNYADLLRKAARLHDIYVDENARHSGVGEALMAAALDAASRMGADKLVLSVAARNHGAQGFFERAGFRTTMFEMMLELPVQGSEGFND